MADGVRRGALDVEAVATEALNRIEAGNPALNAVVNYDRSYGLANAARVKARVKAGETLPLAGVPLIVKDNIWVGGRRITQGSKLFEDFVAPTDALAVARLVEAGAVIVGIGACSEFAAKGLTVTPLYGPTHHPMDHTLTPGGSSGGNAAAVAAGFVPLSLGTDAGGSSRRPPAHCGLVGFKPSFGAVPYGPGFVEPFWGTSALCPITRDVADAKLMFEVMAGPHPDDPDSVEIAPLDARPMSSLKIAYSPRFGLNVPIDEEVVLAIEAGVKALRSAGYIIEEADIPWPEGITEMSVMPLQHAGLAALYTEAWAKRRADIDPDLGAQIESGGRFGAADVAKALAASEVIRHTVGRFFNRFDLVVGPTTPCVAWPWTKLGPDMIGGKAVPPRGHAVFTPLFNHAQTPAISIPCGTGRAGLPIGLQIVGAKGRDRMVLAAAGAFETVLNGNA
ncbi:MAG: amidase [Alphaproteobacteria bacterium]